jgi:hypothetical protein
LRGRVEECGKRKKEEGGARSWGSWFFCGLPASKSWDQQVEHAGTKGRVDSHIRASPSFSCDSSRGSNPVTSFLVHNRSRFSVAKTKSRPLFSGFPRSRFSVAKTKSRSPVSWFTWFPRFLPGCDLGSIVRKSIAAKWSCGTATNRAAVVGGDAGDSSRSSGGGFNTNGSLHD